MVCEYVFYEKGVGFAGIYSVFNSLTYYSCLIVDVFATFVLHLHYLDGIIAHKLEEKKYGNGRDGDNGKKYDKPVVHVSE